jgi:segregation and condensation protein A
MGNDAGPAVELKIQNFEGPLELLLYLIEKNRIDIYDIPIAQITEQYLDYLNSLQDPDLEIASEFLVMAATLIHIKSRLLLPQRGAAVRDSEEDPREELVLRLLEYRRCKMIAQRLKENHEAYTSCMYRLPETPARLGFDTGQARGGLNWDSFWRASQQVARQNQLRFNDLSSKITYILRRDKVSLKEKMRLIWRSVVNKTRVYFSELFPAGKVTRMERVTGFLALLELLRLNRVKVRQDKPFDVIQIEGGSCAPINNDEELDRFLAEKSAEAKAND